MIDVEIVVTTGTADEMPYLVRELIMANEGRNLFGVGRTFIGDVKSYRETIDHDRGVRVWAFSLTGGTP